MTNKVIMPLGELAGKEQELPRALFGLASEMLARRDELHAATLEAQAQDLERYALALLCIWYQTEEPAQRDQHLIGSLAGYLELGRKHGLTLPAELEAHARKDKRKRRG